MKFVNFYDSGSKKQIHNALDVSTLDRVPMEMRYSKEKDRQTLVFLLADGKELCVTSRLDKLGRLSVYMNNDVLAESEVTVL